MDAEGEKDELQGVVEDLQTEKEKLSEELDSKQVCYSFFIWHNQSEVLYSYPVLDSDTSSACNLRSFLRHHFPRKPLKLTGHFASVT